MRTFAVLALVVLAAVGGFALWFTASSSEQVPNVTPASEVAAAPAQREPGGADVELTTPAVAPESATPERAALVAEPEPVATKADGRATIAGRVVDDTGRPVAGAEVAARESRFGVFAGRHRLDDGIRTKTGPDGRFELRSQAGDYTLAVGASGFAPLRSDVVVGEGQSRDVGNLALDRGVELRGRVVDLRGQPVAGALLYGQRANHGSGMIVIGARAPGSELATTDEDGAFVIDRQAVGPWSLLAKTDDHPDGETSGETTMKGEKVAGIEIVLEDGFEITGRVVGVPAAMQGNLSVRARSAATQVIAGIEAFGGDERQATVAADGSFTVRGLKADQNYRVSARAENGTFGNSTRSDVVETKPGGASIELEYGTGAALVFQVVDAEGTPIEDFEVRAGFEFPLPLTSDAGGIQRKHPDGKVRFQNLRPRGGSNQAQLEIIAVGFERHKQTGIRMRSEEELDLGVITLSPLPLVVVRVEDANGDPVGGARVSLAESAPEPSAGSFSFRREVRVDDGDGETVIMGGDPFEQGKTDADGVCELSSMPGKQCTLRVEHEEFATYQSAALELPVEGDYEHDVRLTGGSRVEVTVLDASGQPVAGANVEHRAPASDGQPLRMDALHGPGRRTDADGRAEFAQLQDGTHAFRLNEENPRSGGMFFRMAGQDELGDDWTQVDVIAGESYSLTLSASPRAELNGVVTEDGVPLANAKVKLISADGDDAHMGMGPETAAYTDAEGFYEFDDIKVEGYELEISHATRAMPMSFDVRLAVGPNSQDFDLPVSILEGRVTDDEGDPVAGIKVRAQRAQSGGERRMAIMISVTDDGEDSNTIITDSSANDPSATTDDDGRYVLRGVQAATPVVVEARGGDYEPTKSESVEVALGATRSGVDLVLSKAGALEVKAVGPEGQPAGGFLVTANFSGETEQQLEPKVSFLQASGKTKLTGLKPGPWIVTLQSVGLGGSDEAEPIPAQTVEVRATETATATFTVP